MPEMNLGTSLGQACVQSWTGHVTEMTPQQQVASAAARPSGTGFLLVRRTARFDFGILCLKGCFVVAPHDVARVLATVERWMLVPVPWTAPVGAAQAAGIRFAWCPPGFSCPGQERDGSSDQTGRYPDVYFAKGLCLPMYDTTQRRSDGSANSFAANQSNAAWKTFWLAVGDAVARYNAGEPAVR